MRHFPYDKEDKYARARYRKANRKGREDPEYGCSKYGMYTFGTSNKCSMGVAFGTSNKCTIMQVLFARYKRVSLCRRFAFSLSKDRREPEHEECFVVGPALLS
jgi:hypothetical protein